MKTKTNVMIAAAALGGLIIGTAGRASASSLPTSASQSISAQSRSVTGTAVSHDAGFKANLLDDDTKGKHDCKTKNDCKGLGGCKSGDNGCKGKNSCKGKGGCDTNHPKDKDKDESKL
jgi:hypothetical protein